MGADVLKTRACLFYSGAHGPTCFLQQRYLLASTGTEPHVKLFGKYLPSSHPLPTHWALGQKRGKVLPVFLFSPLDISTMKVQKGWDLGLINNTPYYQLSVTNHQFWMPWFLSEWVVWKMMELTFWSAAKSLCQIFSCSAGLNTEALRAFLSWECGKGGTLNEQTREN